VFKSLDEKEYSDFVSVADDLRGDYQFVHTLDSSFVPDKGVALVAPAVRLYKSFDEGFNDAQVSLQFCSPGFVENYFLISLKFFCWTVFTVAVLISVLLGPELVLKVFPKCTD
jgi:hypothetical protein